ncbi:recombinase [Clostridium tetani]|uniref:Recombinase n=1 Tax=Clostridium tetani TaxID=1513 RepID=A0A4Q0VH70_CLOTA|nr:ERF family protein [Clostridium tetani]RXI50667.1 recombinase [Clostridium tetani]
MNIYKKLAEARVKLQEAELKKSGLNKFAGYEYFELSDFLPKINEINKELGICTVISFGAEYAIMMIIDVDKPEDSIELKSPMKEATLKGCHPIQNLGAIQSYQRRYLYMAAYEIVENDMLDATTGNEPVGGKDNKLSEAQVNRLFAIAKSVGIDNKKVKQHVLTKYGTTEINTLTKQQYDEACEGYEKLKK